MHSSIPKAQRLLAGVKFWLIDCVSGDIQKLLLALFPKINKIIVKAIVPSAKKHLEIQSGSSTYEQPSIRSWTIGWECNEKRSESLTWKICFQPIYYEPWLWKQQIQRRWRCSNHETRSQSVSSTLEIPWDTVVLVTEAKDTVSLRISHTVTFRRSQSSD